MKRVAKKPIPVEAKATVKKKLATNAGVQRIAVSSTLLAFEIGAFHSAVNAGSQIEAALGQLSAALQNVHSFAEATKAKMHAGVLAQLAAQGVSADGKILKTETTPEGPFILIEPIVQEAAANRAARRSVAKKTTNAVKPVVKTARKPAVAPKKNGRSKADPVLAKPIVEPVTEAVQPKKRGRPRKMVAGTAA